MALGYKLHYCTLYIVLCVHCIVFCLQEDTHVIYTCNNINIIVARCFVIIITELEWKRVSFVRKMLRQCSVLCFFAARLHGGGCIFLSLSIGALGLQIISSYYIFLSLSFRFVRSSTSRLFLESVLGGRGAGCFRFVGGARTIILSIKLRWRYYRFSRDTEMPTSNNY